MPVFIRLRWAAFRLVRTLRRSILDPDSASGWELDADTRGRPILTAGPMRIVINPRAVRLFDAVHLYVDGVEVWLPILARLRLRSAVRWFVLRHAFENSQHVAPKRTRSTRTRKRGRQEQST